MRTIHLKHHQIDKAEWDFAIGSSGNGLVYALSWYLDIVSPNWEALITENYKAVMPLTVKCKYGLRYIVQPPFSQQLGIFSSDKQINVGGFLVNIPTKYRAVYVQMNPENRLTDTDIRINYELNLIKGYDELRQNYNTNTIRALKRAGLTGLTLKTDVGPNELWGFKRANPANKLSNWHYQKLQNLLETIMDKSMGESLGLYNSKNNMVAVVFFVKYKNRATMLVSSSNAEGKEKAASFLLIDHFIRKYAGKDVILDFEGGSIEGLARFFSGFGAYRQNYYFYKVNRFIWPLSKIL